MPLDKVKLDQEPYTQSPCLNVSEKAQEVLCEMIFQMGYSGVGKFKNMIKALQNNDTKTASIEMLDSRWAKQTPNRAKELSDDMANA